MKIRNPNVFVGLDPRRPLPRYKSMEVDLQTIRENEGKLQWSLPDYNSLKPLIEVMMYGSNKYERDNWKKGGQTREQILDSLLRHVIALQSGEENDPEHGISHVGGVLFNAMMYEYYKNNKLFRE